MLCSGHMNRRLEGPLTWAACASTPDVNIMEQPMLRRVIGAADNCRPAPRLAWQ